MDREDHWEKVYSTRMAEKLGWYKPRLDVSLAWIAELNLDAHAPIIDIGGGASTLVDDLIDEGYESIAVLDIAESALATSKKRLGQQSNLVMWLKGDVAAYPLPQNRFELWHDRGALHFLTESVDQQAYRDNLLNSLRPGGHVIIGVFAPEAPPRCSGIAVQRFDHEQLSTFLGNEFELLRHQTDLHVTPGKVEQMYLYCLFRRSED
jgi:SAM-dependent methyltransferase